MLFLKWEGKSNEVLYADMLFCHLEWQRDYGLRAPSGPLMLTLKKEENKTKRGQIKRCLACSIRQRCIRSDKVYHAKAQEWNIFNLLKAPPKGREDEDEGEKDFPKREDDCPKEKKTQAQKAYPLSISPS